MADKKRSIFRWAIYILGIIASGLLSLAALICAISGIFCKLPMCTLLFVCAFVIACPAFDPLLKRIRGKKGRVLSNRTLRVLAAGILFVVGGAMLGSSVEPVDKDELPPIPATTQTTEPTMSPAPSLTPETTMAPTSTPTVVSSTTPTAMPTPTISATPTLSIVPILSPTVSAKLTATPTPTATPKPTVTPKPTATLKTTVSPKPTATPTATPKTLYYIPGCDAYTIMQNLESRYGFEHPRPAEGYSGEGYSFFAARDIYSFEIYTYKNLKDVIMVDYNIANYSYSQEKFMQMTEAYFVYAVSTPYDTCDVETAQKWIRNNLNKVTQGNPAETIIGDAKIEICGDPNTGYFSLSISVYPFPY